MDHLYALSSKIVRRTILRYRNVVLRPTLLLRIRSFGPYSEPSPRRGDGTRPEGPLLGLRPRNKIQSNGEHES